MDADSGSGEGGHVVGGEEAEGFVEVVRVGAGGFQEGDGGVVGGEPGEGVQGLDGAGVAGGEGLEGLGPDAGDGAFGVDAVGCLVELGGQAPAVGLDADGGVLPKVGAGLFECEGQVPQLGGQRAGFLGFAGRGRPVRERVGTDEFCGLVGVEDSEGVSGDDVGPSDGAAAGDEVVAAVEGSEVGGQVGGCFDVVEDE
ncbi:hypothetical protein GCM10009665_50880 [Kitasatospora nipponensis]|uniref:Uncharacterized protein n=1 Tax=Kitasatospora nipponensis TaxID=258049 RepID=A0ABN1WPU1_9ACTN